MLRIILTASLLGACATPKRPLGGASAITVGSTMTLEQRRDQMALRQLRIPEDQLPSISMAGRTGRRSDPAVLIQNGQPYALPGYLPVLQAEGIATDIEDPNPTIDHAMKARLAWAGGTVAGMTVGLAMMSTENETMQLSGLGFLATSAVVGSIGGWIHPMMILAPVRRDYKKARRHRGKWSEEFNAGLAKKLGAGDATVPVAPSGDGPMLVPAPTAEPAKETRHK